jgi:TRAP transporter 4TM/12TM fusion protein
VPDKLDLSKEALSAEQTEQLIDEFETPTRKLKGNLNILVTVLAVACSLFALYGAASTVMTQLTRYLHVLLILVLTYLLYPINGKNKFKGFHIDIVLAIVAFIALAYPIIQLDSIITRVATPLPLDIIMGVVTILLILEATRRSTGWALPILVVVCILYAFFGAYLPDPFGHRGYGISRLVSAEYLTLDGIFGTPIEVSSTFIILFTIYGAMLEFSGAGKFFVDFALGCMGKKRSGPGRAVTFASFLLGTVSGSGAATTVTLGAVTWPLLKKAGYDRESAGGLLAAGGIGAILSPPVLGAASFLIADILKISYLQVLVMASIPTILYYLSIFLMVDGDARKFSLKSVEIEEINIPNLVKKYWFHFASLLTIVVLMAYGLSAMYAVFYSILIAIGVSFFNREEALFPKKLVNALAAGTKQVLSVAATCACAGIIVGILNLTGLGLKFSSIILSVSNGNLVFTLMLTAVILLILGLALPVTASYIVAAVMVAPALVKLGVPEVAAHMFIFYYSVLSEVSPPTALACFAAAAITNGNPYKTMMKTIKYTLPAFLVPFAFTTSPEGMGILLQGSILNIIVVSVTAALGVWALAGCVGADMFGPLNKIGRGALLISGLLLFYAGSFADILGIGILISVIAYQFVINRNRKVNMAV